MKVGEVVSQFVRDLFDQKINAPDIYTEGLTRIQRNPNLVSPFEAFQVAGADFYITKGREHTLNTFLAFTQLSRQQGISAETVLAQLDGLVRQPPISTGEEREIIQRLQVHVENKDPNHPLVKEAKRTLQIIDLTLQSHKKSSH